MRWFGRLTPVVVVAVGIAMEMQQTSAARILMAVPISTRSHNNFFMPIAEHLARRNHTVTFIAGYEPPKTPPNVKVVLVPGVQIFEKMPDLFTTNVHTTMTYIYDEMKTVCVDALGYEGVQKLKEERFDLLMLHIGLTECFLTFAYELQIPFIFVNPNKILGISAYAVGSPAFPSLTASFLLDLEYPLTFMGRMISTLYDMMAITSNKWVLIPSQDAACRARKLCSDDMPDLTDLLLNSSLCITNSIRTMESPTLPYTPTVVHAGGIHCRPAQPLPEDLELWIAGAGKPGVILFSLGSVVKSSTMPEEYRKVLLEVFGSLQQRVLWKWDEDTMEGLPSNVRLSKWLPQQDVLGHPQLRLFITHGGLFSIQEATYHGVPIIGMAVSLDQRHNMKLVEREGWGRALNWKDLTYDSLSGHIRQILNEPGWRKEAQRRAKMMRDQPVPPGEWTTYWVEYVLRHQGARHLHSPAVDIPWYQLYNTDVWAVVVVVTVLAAGLATWLSYKVLKALIGCCFRSKKSKKD